MPDAKLTFAGLTGDQWEAWTRRVEEASRLEIAAFCAPDAWPKCPVCGSPLRKNEAPPGTTYRAWLPCDQCEIEARYGFKTPMQTPSLASRDALGGVSEGRDAPGQAENGES